ncbi:unnamed protein product [Sphagnum jensenii]|jgi:ATP-dependent Clp protease adaptor protein ClpS
MADWEDDDDHSDDGESSVVTESKQKVEKPPLYKVLLHNDDYTTMEFVVFILKNVFHKSELEARKIMLAVHLQGLGVAGVYTYEIAEAKVTKVIDTARSQQYPLLCTMEEE